MIISRSAAETVDYGRRLASELQAGAVLALTGDLGAGKTCLVKGLAAGLGIAQDVTSPTFTIIHEYRGGRVPLVHVDLYRLDTVQQALATGIEDYLDGDGITVIEWADKIRELLPPKTRHIGLTVIDENTRRIEST